MQQQSIDETLAHIQQLYEFYGQETYEEKCTQLQHAQQCGTLALEWGLSEEVALAAFLHDIGHLLAQERKIAGFTPYGYASHDKLGADFLTQCGFSSRIDYLVREHVQVKRYLAATVSGYTDTLSHASTVTLQQQGGAMTTEEASTYSATPHLAEIIQLRKLDDTGKLPEMACPGLSFWLALARKNILNNQT